MIVHVLVSQTTRCTRCGLEEEIPSRVYRDPEKLAACLEVRMRRHGDCAQPKQPSVKGTR